MTASTGHFLLPWVHGSGGMLPLFHCCPLLHCCSFSTGDCGFVVSWSAKPALLICWIRIYHTWKSNSHHENGACKRNTSFAEFTSWVWEPLLPLNNSSTVSPNRNGSFLLKEKLKHMRAERKIRLEPASSCLQNYQCTFQKVAFSPLRKLFYSLLQNSERVSFCGKTHSKAKGSFPPILIVKSTRWQIYW